MFATVKNGKFTGAGYPEMTDTIRKWHEENNLSFVKVDSMPPNVGTEDDPDYGYVHDSYFVPQSVSRRQGRLALLSAGYLDQVESAIDAIEDSEQKRAAQIEYEADTWERKNEFLASMWAQLGGTEQELDDLFVAASKL